MNSAHKTLLSSSALLAEAISETLWPTRCSLCDTPGSPLCTRCRLHLPYLDELKACKVCGAAYGNILCTECNSMILDWKGLSSFPLDGCASALMLNDNTHRLVIRYKDQGEQRLCKVFAEFLYDTLPDSWPAHAAIVPIPARKKALRKRGFDHVVLLAQSLAQKTQQPLLQALSMLERADQRSLDAHRRLANMRVSFRVIKPLPPAVILVDDVFTTGATLFSAANALYKQGARKIFGLTLVRA